MNKTKDINERFATKGEVESLNKIMIGIIIVLFLGFVSILVTVIGFTLDAFRYKQATYQTLIDKVDEQNSKIESLLNFSQQQTVRYIPIKN